MSWEKVEKVDALRCDAGLKVETRKPARSQDGGSVCVPLLHGEYAVGVLCASSNGSARLTPPALNENRGVLAFVSSATVKARPSSETKAASSIHFGSSGLSMSKIRVLPPISSGNSVLSRVETSAPARHTGAPALSVWPYSAPEPNTFVRPSTVFALDPEARPPHIHNWNASVQRSFAERYVVEMRYVGARGSNLPRNVEANPAVYAPGATAQNADRRRIYGNCPADGGACALSTVAMVRSVARSRYDAAQISVSRRFAGAKWNAVPKKAPVAVAAAAAPAVMQTRCPGNR